VRLFGAREEVAVHADCHRNEHDGVVEQVQLDLREPDLRDAGRDGSAEEVVMRESLVEQQPMLDVMPELDP